VFWIYAVALALGYVQVLDRPAGQAFQYELVGPEDLPQAVGLHSTTMSSARLLGPALAGAAYSLIGSAACFAINGVSFLCVIFALLAMRAAELHPRIRDAKPARGQVVEGVRYAWQHPDLRALLAVNALIGCLAFNFMTTITAMVRFEFHADANALGAAHALNAAGAVLGSLAIAALQRPLTRSALALLCATLGFTILVNALTPGLWWFLLWAPFFGFSVGAYQTAVTTAVQRAAEPGMLGRVSSLLVLGSVGTTPIGSLIVGWLIDAWSARAAMGLGALACGLGAVMLAAAQPIRRTARGACR
jgi:predicted MFS family arabinose efflux permease